MDTWLADHITTTTGRPPGGRNARPDHCRDCKAPILTGLDEDLCAVVAWADPIALSRLGEATARIAGRQTYWLRRNGQKLYLTRRPFYVIKAFPAGTRGPQCGDVIPAHVCGAGYPDACITDSILRTRTEKETRSNDNPPF